MRMVGKLVIIVAATVGMAVLNVSVEALVQLLVAINLAELAMVVEHRGRISTLETAAEVDAEE